MNELKQVQVKLRTTMYQIDKAKTPYTIKKLWAKYYKLLYRENELLGRQK